LAFLHLNSLRVDIAKMLGHLLLVVLAITTPAMALHVQLNSIPSSVAESSPEQIKMQTNAIWAKAAEGLSTEASKVADNKDICNHIHAPSMANYHLWKPDEEWFSQIGQDKRLANLLNSTAGFFIESGAADGELNSNTLHFEKKGWTGLLVEPHPQTFQTLLGKNRKAHAYNGALSTARDYGTLYLDVADCAGYSGDGECSQVVNGNGNTTIEVQVAPLEELLTCLEQSTVDFWSLDVEGVEGAILKSFPFEHVEMGVLLIEMNKAEDNNKQIEQVMESNGFQECGRTAFDRIYVNPLYFNKRGLQIPATC
jgi:FkbM family methyltransferase